jgi:hypothetical protein
MISDFLIGMFVLLCKAKIKLQGIKYIELNAPTALKLGVPFRFMNFLKCIYGFLILIFGSL